MNKPTVSSREISGSQGVSDGLTGGNPSPDGGAASVCATKIEVILNPAQLALNSGTRITDENASFLDRYLPYFSDAFCDFFALFLVCLLWNVAGMFALLVIRSRAAVFGATVGAVASTALWTSVGIFFSKINNLSLEI